MIDVLGPGYFAGWAFVFGACVGSFLNVVVARWPRGMSVVKPGSHCPKCGHVLPWWQNLPIISYLALRARCASCKVFISPRYVVLEFICGVLWAALVFRFGVEWETLLWFWIASCCVAIVSLDLNHWWIPDVLVIQVAVAGLLFPLATGTGDWVMPLMGLVPAFALWAFVALYGRLRGLEVMGFGDIKLFAAFGLCLGWQPLLSIILLSSLIGLTIGGSLLLLGYKHEADTSVVSDEDDAWEPPATAIPFGPSIVIAFLALVLMPEQLDPMRWIEVLAFGR